LLLLAGAATAVIGSAQTRPQALPIPLDEGITAVADVAAVPAMGVDAQWWALSPLQRQEWRARYQDWQALDEAERRRVLRAAAEFARLPAERQQQLRAQFAALDGLVQRGWRLGPELGGDYPALQPLLGFVPETEREPLLALLRSLDATQRAQLIRLAQRTPPQEREALRGELLALSAQARRAWLQQRVGD
jgi:hypothetical protein